MWVEQNMMDLEVGLCFRVQHIGRYVVGTVGTLPAAHCQA